MQIGFAVSSHRVDWNPVTQLTVWWSADACLVTADGLTVYCAGPGLHADQSSACGLSVTDTHIVLCSGYLHNREEVAHLLGAPALATERTATVLGRAYKEWGPRLQSRVTGEYSYVIVDRASGAIAAGRDSLGVGRAYYSDSNYGISLASTLPLLLATLPSTPPLDEDGLAEFLNLGDLGGERTVYRSVKVVRRGCTLVWEGGLQREVRAWEPDLSREHHFPDPHEYAERCRALLFEAVGRCAYQAGPMCTQLSGGLDSSTVTAVAGSLAMAGTFDASHVSVFSVIASRTRQSDESEYQRAVMKCYPLRHVEIDADAYPAFGPFEGSVPCEPTMYLANGIVHRGIKRFAESDGLRACLTGQGGDAIFVADASTPWYLREWLRHGRIVPWARAVQGFTQHNKHSLLSLLKVSFRRQAAESMQVGSWIRPSMRQKVIGALNESLMQEVAGHPYPARALQFALTHRVASYLRRSCIDWSERHPLLYRPLVEFMLAAPWELKLGASGNRALQRQAIAGLVPDVVRMRPDKGRPDGAFLRGIARNWDTVKELARGKRLAAIDIIDAKGFETECIQMRHGHISRSTGFSCLWSSLTLELWLSLGGLTRGAAVRDEHTLFCARLKEHPMTGSVLQ